jgi:NAD(P)-dependent dehydrogenase (short-subunit alcohol dehydrogenase family)
MEYGTRMSLEGATAIVTGGASGIGHGIAIELANAGAAVAIADLDLAKAKLAAQELNSRHAHAIAVHLDVAKQDSVETCVAEVLRQLSHVDILVNNAGIFQRRLGLELEDDDFSACLDVNLIGIWRMTKALVPNFKARGAGKVVNISSTGGRRGFDFAPAYCAAKAGVISLTQSLALALGPDKVNVNAVCPGSIATSMRDQIRALGANVASESAGSGPAYALAGTLTASDIGRAVVFLASDFARNITGQSLNVDRGYVMN